jgi:hypothetical protein
MKNKFIYVATVVLMANGLMFARSLGDLPASREVGRQSDAGVTSSCVLPGAMGTQVQNTGVGLNGQLPGTGLSYDRQGNVSSNSMLLPGTEISPVLSNRLSGL